MAKSSSGTSSYGGGSGRTDADIADLELSYDRASHKEMWHVTYKDGEELWYEDKDLPEHVRRYIDDRTEKAPDKGPRPTMQPANFSVGKEIYIDSDDSYVTRRFKNEGVRITRATKSNIWLTDKIGNVDRYKIYRDDYGEYISYYVQSTSRGGSPGHLKVYTAEYAQNRQRYRDWELGK